jgi:fucose permease
MTKSRGLSQNLILCALITALGMLFSVLSSLLDRIALSFGQGAAMAGVYLSIYMTGSCLSAFFGGSLADRVGKRRVILAGMLVLVVGLMAVAVSGSVIFTFAGLFLMGVGFGPSESMGSALLTDENPERATLWMNFSQIGFGVGAIASPMLIVWHMDGGGDYRGVFAACAAMLALLALVLFVTGKGASAYINPNSGVNSFALLREKRYLLYALMVFFYLGYEAVAPVYFKQLFLEKGAGEQMATMSISIFWAAMLACRLIGAFLSGRELLSIKFCTGFVLAGIAVLLAAQSNAVRILGVALYGFGCGPVWPMLFVLASRVFPDRSGAAYGVMMLFSTAGGSLFPALIGSWAGSTTVTFTLCAGLAVLVIVGAELAGRMGKPAVHGEGLRPGI